MALTRTDLENLERAAIALATGARVASVGLENGPQTDWTEATLPQLRSFIYEVREQVLQAESSTRRNYFLGQTSKGY